MWPNMSQPSQNVCSEFKAILGTTYCWCVDVYLFQVPSQTLEAPALAFAPVAPAGWVYEDLQHYIFYQLWLISVRTCRENWVSVGQYVLMSWRVCCRFRSPTSFKLTKSKCIHYLYWMVCNWSLWILSSSLSALYVWICLCLCFVFYAAFWLWGPSSDALVAYLPAINLTDWRPVSPLTLLYSLVPASVYVSAPETPVVQTPATPVSKTPVRYRDRTALTVFLNVLLLNFVLYIKTVF